MLPYKQHLSAPLAIAKIIAKDVGMWKIISLEGLCYLTPLQYILNTCSINSRIFLEIYKYSGICTMDRYMNSTAPS